MDAQRTPDELRDLVGELRQACRSGKGNYGLRLLCGTAADCIEQLQMPPAKVRELAQTDEGADTLALIRALSMQVDGQRKHIATLKGKQALRQLLSPIEWDHLKDWHKNSILTCRQVDDFVGARVHGEHYSEMQALEKRP
jgi:hypothetical protein